ncbi:hypothetical protein EVG20_g3233 [Dentipellis fragilis]|uniref:Cupin type-1 domain-containing protein n=1 Tax=Dentipellis fragilis TaxID=205917 RepID=A0A4Y9Z5U0_9AGAM|nr:hypothetical protein EVG20_g3233 [Dentipellis fragilis]
MPYQSRKLVDVVTIILALECPCPHLARPILGTLGLTLANVTPELCHAKRTMLKTGEASRPCRASNGTGSGRRISWIILAQIPPGSADSHPGLPDPLQKVCAHPSDANGIPPSSPPNWRSFDRMFLDRPSPIQGNDTVWLAARSHVRPGDGYHGTGARRSKAAVQETKWTRPAFQHSYSYHFTTPLTSLAIANMVKFSASLLFLITLAVSAYGAPAANGTDAATSSVASASSAASAPASSVTPAASSSDATPTTVISETATVKPVSDDPNAPIFQPGTNPGSTPEAIRGSLGASVLGPQNIAIDQQNPDFLAPPSTDNGDVPNAKWPFGLSHNRLQTGGWARQQNIEVMPIATEMAGVNMRLEAGAIRELHWHKTAEWAYVIKGSTQITSVNQNGQNYIATVNPGDLWYFPPGIPHSLQATGDGGEGSEFLLVFDDGSFSDDSTFLLTDWLAHVPMDVIAKNFQTNITTFDHIPSEQLYIFPAVPPADDAQPPSDPQGQIPEPFSFALSQMKPTQLQGGTVKIVDSTIFNISKTIAVAELTVEPGAIRELHWHPTQDEWTFYLSGSSRVTIFASSSNARTFDFQAGDIGYVPASYGPLCRERWKRHAALPRDLQDWYALFPSHLPTLLNDYPADRFQDISLQQWLALTPPELVKAHLGLSDEAISHLSKTKQIVVGGSGSNSNASD